MTSRPIRKIAALLFCAMLCLWGLSPLAARAHDLPLDRIMTGFVTIEPDHAHLVVHIPLDLLRAIPFPIDRQGRYDLAASGDSVNVAVKALASDLIMRENGNRLVPSSTAGRMTPLADRSFGSYDEAVAHVAEPTDPEDQITNQLGYLDIHFIYPIKSPASIFTIQTLVDTDLGDAAKLTIRYQAPGEADRAMILTTADGEFSLDPPWYQASGGFIKLGIEHILTGIDHLLFLLCLVIPFRRVTPLVPVITAFTLGHSITLVGAAYNLGPSGAWFSPFIETGIAASIVYMALENITGAELRRRWIIAGLFGLVHGFGFSSALKGDLQFAGSHLLVSLFSFNVGIEIGQLVMLCLFVPALALLFRGAMSGRMGIIVLSALVAHTAWHWMIDRGEVLWQTPWPLPTTASLMVVAQWIVALGLAVTAALFLSRWLERRWPRLVETTGRPVDG